VSGAPRRIAEKVGDDAHRKKKRRGMKAVRSGKLIGKRDRDAEEQKR
jgi:hypothetical protein